MRKLLKLGSLLLLFILTTTTMFGFGKPKTEPKTQKQEFHPQNQKPIELVFELNGTSYYKFKNASDLPQLRMTMGMQFLAESGQVMSNELLNACLDNLIKNKESGNSEKFYSQIAMMRGLAQSVNYTDAFYHVCSALTFTLDENIYDYDPGIAKEHIANFQSLQKSFFLTTLSESFQSMQMRLPKDLENHLAKQDATLKAHTQSLETLGVELPTSLKSKMSNSGLAETLPDSTS